MLNLACTRLVLRRVHFELRLLVFLGFSGMIFSRCIASRLHRMAVMDRTRYTRTRQNIGNIVPIYRIAVIVPYENMRLATPKTVFKKMQNGIDIQKGAFFADDGTGQPGSLSPFNSPLELHRLQFDSPFDLIACNPPAHIIKYQDMVKRRTRSQ